MAAHKIEDYSDSTTQTNNMPFDTTFDREACVPHCPSATREGGDDASASKLAPPCAVSSSPLGDPLSLGDQEPLLCDEHQRVDDSITGRYSDIKRRYRIDPQVLGTGHNGSVRECTDRRTGERFAVKSIHKGDPTVKSAGLAREILLLQEMDHDNVVRLVDVYEDADYVHIITDLFEGGELFDRIVEESTNDHNGARCFPEEEAARIVCGILEGVAYMHDRGIVHRDIKPENILFESKQKASRVKIIDFGLSRNHSSKTGEPLMSTVVGTPYYVAPEVLRRRYDKSCDLWSVGVIAYVLLCGYPPFNGRNGYGVHRSVLRDRIRFPIEDWNVMSADAVDFVYRLLQKDPRRRMTAKQALAHPWMMAWQRRGHAREDLTIIREETEEDAVDVMKEERRDDFPSVCYTDEVLYSWSLPKSPKTAMRKERHTKSNSPLRRKVKLSMFVH